MEQQEGSENGLTTQKSVANKNIICFLCKKEMKFDRVVKKKSIEALLATSKQRSDKSMQAVFAKLLEDEDCQISIHELCHMNYKNPPPKRRRKTLFPGFNRRQLLEIPPSEFVYDKMCLFCGQDASDEFLKRSKKKNSMKGITKVSNNGRLQETILNYPDDPEYDNLKARFDKKFDLFELKARYHRHCYKKVLPTASTTNAGSNFKKQEYFLQILNHIKSNPGQNFYGINEFIESREDLKNDPDSRPLDVSIRKNLIKELGDDYKVLNVSGYGLLAIRAEHVQDFDMESWKIDQLKKFY